MSHSSHAENSADTVTVRIETEIGDILLAIDRKAAPLTAANFLRYVDGDFYNGGRFHRAVTLDNQPNNDVRIEVIQASINPERVDDAFPPIALERTTLTGLLHTDGTVSMARFAPDSANYDFFICIGDQPELDFGGKRYDDGQGFAAFGRVIQGNAVVRAIQQSPIQAQKLSPPIRILSVSRLNHEPLDSHP